MRTLMQTVLALFILGGAQNSWALPIVNANAPGAENVTVFPDHQDKNLFYLAPNVMLVAKDEKGVPQFSYVEYRTGIFSKGAIVQSTLRPTFYLQEMEAVKAKILKGNPSARFTSLPFQGSEVVFGDNVLKPLIKTASCDHPAGMVGDEQSCSFELNNRGRKVLRPLFKQGLTITLQLAYTVSGVLQTPDGKFLEKENHYQMAGRIGGPELAEHPELFRDADGKVIQKQFVQDDPAEPGELSEPSE